MTVNVLGLEATSLAILLVPGFLPFFFLAQNYLTLPPTPTLFLPRNQDRASVIMCCFVFLLGPFAASIAALRIVSTTSRQDSSLTTIIIILQNLVQFSCMSPTFSLLASFQCFWRYTLFQDRLPILLLLNRSSALVRVTRSTISDRRLDAHNIILATLMTTCKPISYSTSHLPRDLHPLHL